LIEETEGAFPVWLAPEQVVIMNITDRQAEYCSDLEKRLNSNGFRAKLDLRNEKIGFKIREHTLQRVPYMIVVGDKEVEQEQVAVRTRTGEDLGVMSISEFEGLLQQEIARRSRKQEVEIVL
jgi:threonyl-tRNA synthetase